MSRADELLNKARRSLDAAARLLEAGDTDFAASPAYYASFFVATALLDAEGLQFRRHSQLIGQFGVVFAQSGRLDPAFHRLLIDGFRLRQLSDYIEAPEALPDPRDVEALLQGGERFLRAAALLLSGPNRP